MTNKEIKKYLIEFGFKDCTKEWYPERGKIQNSYKLDPHVIILDDPMIIYTKAAEVEDESNGLSIPQLIGFRAYLNLENEYQDKITEPKLHLDELYEKIQAHPNYYRYKAYTLFRRKYEGTKLATD